VRDDRNYFLMRAEEEKARAAESGNKQARRARLRLASTYRRAALKRCPRSLPGVDLLNVIAADFLRPPHPRQP